MSLEQLFRDSGVDIVRHDRIATRFVRDRAELIKDLNALMIQRASLIKRITELEQQLRQQEVEMETAASGRGDSSVALPTPSKAPGDDGLPVCADEQTAGSANRPVSISASIEP